MVYLGQFRISSPPPTLEILNLITFFVLQGDIVSFRDLMWVSSDIMFLAYQQTSPPTPLTMASELWRRAAGQNSFLGSSYSKEQLEVVGRENTITALLLWIQTFLLMFSLNHLNWSTG
jgi:hypothetical protein